jgi:pseudoazurin
MSIDGMLPEGAEPWKGKINEQITVTFTKPGLYGYKCQPHYGLGMVGLIEVGDDTSNIETLKAVKLVGAAKKRMAELFAQAEGGAAQ